MFQFPSLAPTLSRYMASNHVGCPIRISSDQGLFAPPRSFSQLITSVFASYSQGIHHSPFSSSLYLYIQSENMHFLVMTYFISDCVAIIVILVLLVLRFHYC